MYAQHGIESIFVSSEGHGGCGQVHALQEGERYFAVDCPQCENHLRTDKMWAATLEDVPESYDDKLKRERQERNQARNQASVVDQAAGLLALLAGPRDLLAGVSPALAPAVATCRKCSAAVMPSASFCGDCGAPQLRQIESGAA